MRRPTVTIGTFCEYASRSEGGLTIFRAFNFLFSEDVEGDCYFAATVITDDRAPPNLLSVTVLEERDSGESVEVASESQTLEPLPSPFGFLGIDFRIRVPLHPGPSTMRYLATVTAEQFGQRQTLATFELPYLKHLPGTH